MENTQPHPNIEPYLAAALEPDEELRAHARAREAVLAVSDRRLIVAARERLTLAIGFAEVRRVQFDIERDRPATLVIVPEEAHNEPQVLAIPPDQLRATAEVLALIGDGLAQFRHVDRGNAHG